MEAAWAWKFHKHLEFERTDNRRIKRYRLQSTCCRRPDRLDNEAYSSCRRLSSITRAINVPYTLTSFSQARVDNFSYFCFYIYRISFFDFYECHFSSLFFRSFFLSIHLTGKLYSLLSQKCYRCVFIKVRRMFYRTSKRFPNPWRAYFTRKI